MKDKLRSIVREMILAEMDEAKQGRISSNFVIANADKANRLKEIFANSDTHKWIADMIEKIMEAGEAGLDRKGIINALKEINPSYKLSTLNDETRSLIKSGVLTMGGLSRPKKEKPATSGKKGRPAKVRDTGMMSDLRAAMQADEVEDEEEDMIDETFLRMQKLAGLKVNEISDIEMLKQYGFEDAKEIKAIEVEPYKEGPPQGEANFKVIFIGKNKKPEYQTELQYLPSETDADLILTANLPFYTRNHLGLVPFTVIDKSGKPVPFKGETAAQVKDKLYKAGFREPSTLSWQAG